MPKPNQKPIPLYAPPEVKNIIGNAIKVITKTITIALCLTIFFAFAR